MLSFFSRFSRATPLAERLTHRYRSGAKETLDLSRMCLTDEAIPEILSFLQTHPEITHLILDKNFFTAPAAFLIDTYIDHLSLKQNNLNDAAIVAFAKTLAAIKAADQANKTTRAQNTIMMRLELNENQITSTGAIALSALIDISDLDLSGNQIGLRGTKALAEDRTYFKMVDLSDNPIGRRGAKILRERFNGLHGISWSTPPTARKAAEAPSPEDTLPHLG
jgi:Ran GTPase-activating protein (RanGAP) involved in mRNA processing and transport